MPLVSEKLKGSFVLRQIEAKARQGLAMGRPTNEKAAVKAVQEALKTLGEDLGGDWVPPSSGLGWYGQHTENAVYSFQSKVWPTSASEWDGKVGQKTLRAIDTRLMGGTPQPVTPGDGAPAPSGVVIPPVDPAAVTFDHPMFMGLGVKLSLQDPLFLPVFGSFLAPFGITIPHGADIVVCGLHKVTKVTDVKGVMAAGVLLGVTSRRGAVPLGLGQAIEAAKKHGADPKVIRFLEQLSRGLASLPSGGAISAGLEFTVATGFANVGAMDGYNSGPEDEATISAAFGPTKGMGKWATRILEAISGTVDLLKDGFLPVLEAMKKLTTANPKALTALDIPGLSLGVDVGVFAGRTTWHSFDIEAALNALPGWLGGNAVTTRAPPRVLLKAPHQAMIRVRRPIG